MSGWTPSRPPWETSRPPWETQDQPVISPDDDSWYGRTRGPRVIIKPHEPTGRGGRPSWSPAPSAETSRGVALVGVIVGLVASVGIAWGAVQLTHVTWGEPPAAPPTPTPTVSPNATSASLTPTVTPPANPTASASGSAGTATAYVLTTPATAGGYTRTTPMSASIQEIGTARATALMQAVEKAGGKATGNVSGEYLIVGDQSIGYAGFTGTFSPNAVITAFGTLATGLASQPAGQHGGLLSCGTVTATSPASSTGTACVWATPTTVGMAEFFSGGALEQVTMSRAGQDTANFRSGVETLKGVTSTASN